MQKPATTGLKSAISALPKLVTDSDDSLEAVTAEKPDRGLKKQTLYLPHGVYEQLRELAFTSRVSQQEIFRRALDMYFAEAGLPSWDEAKAGGKDK